MQPQTLNPPFSIAELASWRTRLIDQARSLRADVGALEAESVPQERVAPNHHLPEGGAELQAADIDASAAAADDDILRLVLRALDKIETGRPVPFGICELTGARIERDRLELMPWTPVCAAASVHLDHDERSRDDLLLP
jgi:RNA polymerase-binding transcription factor DksA